MHLAGDESIILESNLDVDCLIAKIFITGNRYENTVKSRYLELSEVKRIFL